MKYFLDTEFIEKPGSIQLISIGIVAEDGRAYYAVSKDFNLREAWRNEWVRENVLKSIYTELWREDAIAKGHFPDVNKTFTRHRLSVLLRRHGKPTKQIALDVIEFVNPRKSTYKNGIGLDKVIDSLTKADCWNVTYYPMEFEYIKKHNTFIPDRVFPSGFDGKGTERNRALIYNQPEFYAYFADYDWVVFCWLFGRMIDLPKGFPMYCMDLKQMMKERGLTKEWKNKNCPDPDNEHNALADAAWDRNLYNAILKEPK